MRPSIGWLVGDDIFISYSRADGLRYATALANALTGRRFACRIDQYDTSPGDAIPRHLKRSIRHCRMMVVVASERALVSERVREEIEEFAAHHRRGPILITFDQTNPPAPLQALIRGLPRHPEDAQTLETGTPSLPIVDLITNSFQFRRRNRRMFMGFMAMAALTILVGGVGLLLIAQVRSELGRVAQERDQAGRERARLDAENTNQRAAIASSRQELNTLRESVDAQRAEVARQTGIAAALQSIASADTRRRARGYSSALDLFGVLRSAAVLRDERRQGDAQVALADALALQPRLQATVSLRGGLKSAALIARGRRLVTAGPVTQLWDLASARQVAVLPERALSVATTPDGARFMTVSEAGDVRVRDAQSLTIVGTWSCSQPTAPYRFALSPDGLFAAVVCSGSIRIVEVATGTPTAAIESQGFVSDIRLRGRPGNVVAVVYNIGEDMDYRLALYDAATGRRADAGTCAGGFSRFIIDPLGQRVANGCDHGSIAIDSNACKVDVCGLGEAKAAVTLPIQASAVGSFSADGSLLAVSEGGLVGVWSIPDGALVSSLGLRLVARNLHFSHDRGYLAGQTYVARQPESQAWMIQVADGSLLSMFDLPPKVELVALSGDGGVLVSADQARRTLQFWKTNAGQVATVRFTGAATGSSFSADGRYLIARGKRVRSSDEQVSEVWDLKQHAKVAEFGSDIDDDEEERRAAAELDRYVHSGASATELAFLRRSVPAFHSFRIVDRGQLALSGLGDVADRLWNLRRRMSIPLAPPVPSERGVVMTAEGRYLAPRDATVVDVRTGRVAFTADHPVLAVARSGFAVTGEYGLARIWNMSTGENVARIRVADRPTHVAFSPDESQVAVAAGHEVRMSSWRLDDLMNQACKLILDNQRATAWASLTAEPAFRQVCGSGKREDDRTANAPMTVLR